jgi:hypothetical protein
MNNNKARCSLSRRYIYISHLKRPELLHHYQKKEKEITLFKILCRSSHSLTSKVQPQQMKTDAHF